MSDASPSLGITVLGSGSRGNATVLHTESEALLIDVGFSAREMRKRMKQSGLREDLLKAIVVSHEHSDHIKGLRVFAGQTQLPVYANRRTAEALRHRDDKLGRMTIFAAGTPFSIGDFAVDPFSIPHDANDPVAFIVRHGQIRVGIATDLGHVSRLVAYQLRQCHALILESNHDVKLLGNSRRPWALKQRILSRHGHLSNDSSLELLRQVLHPETQVVVMAHASQECNRYEIVQENTTACLQELGRTDVTLHVAQQDEPLPTLWL